MVKKILIMLFAVLGAVSVKGEVVYVNAPNGLYLRQIPTVESKCVGLALIEEHLKHWVREEENNAKLD